MKLIKTLAFLLLTLAFLSVNAQKKALVSKKIGYTTADADTLEVADYLFDQKDYGLALGYYKRLYEVHPEDLALTYRMGICYLYKSDEHGKAIDCFAKILDQDKKATDVKFYLGKAYFLNHQYDQAMDYFSQYNASRKTDPELQKEISRLMQNAENGKKLMADPVDVKIQNLGPPVNTTAAEYGPVISSDESVLMFTYVGPRSTGGKQNVYNQPDPYGIHYEDVFVSNKIKDKWSEPESIGDAINGVSHDACIALSSDGQKLFIYKATSKDMGDIYMSRLQGKEWSYPEKLKGDINKPDSWEGSISLSADEKVIYFSSEKKEGTGERDIYKAVLQSDGSWGGVTNIGSNINTPYNDDAPFIHPDGTQLYFASEGHNSMGGYDIFRSDLQPDGTWSEPVNLGYPVNTADDDKFYVLSADGKRGYYSSGKAGGYGSHDIYVVEPGMIGKKPVILILLKGQVTRNDQPAESGIVVTNAETGENQGDYQSNGASGKYLINLPAGVNYKVTYKMTGYADQVQTFDAKNITAFEEKNIDIRFFDQAELFLVDSTGKVISTGKQIGYGSFVFDQLPPEKNCFFKLVPEDDTVLIKNLKVFITGNDAPRFIVKNLWDKYFRLEQLKADTNTLAKTEEINTTLRIPLSFEEYLNQYGKASNPEVQFWVQIAAFKLPQNFNYNKLSGLGKVEQKDNGDGLTRFVIGGGFKTLDEANTHKKKVVEKGTADAFIYATYQGKRISVKELTERGLLK